MSNTTDVVPDDASLPLRGEAPAPGELKDDGPEAENPNASQHFDAEPDWKKRPDQYPAAKSGLLKADVARVRQAK